MLVSHHPQFKVRPDAGELVLKNKKNLFAVSITVIVGNGIFLA